jgi:hypothetical protein
LVDPFTGLSAKRYRPAVSRRVKKGSSESFEARSRAFPLFGLSLPALAACCGLKPNTEKARERACLVVRHK